MAYVCLVVIVGCHQPQSAQQGMDDDFRASISATSRALVFVIQVKKINPKVRKQIVTTVSTLDCVFVSTRGEVYTKNIHYRIDVLNPRSEPELATSLTRKIIVRPVKLPPGKYIVKPDVRIVEYGKDAVSGRNNNFGSVIVPAGNSVTIILK